MGPFFNSNEASRMGKLTIAVFAILALLVLAWAANARFPNGFDLNLGSTATATSTSSTTTSSFGNSSSIQTAISVAQSTAPSITNSRSALPGDWLSNSPSFSGNSSTIDYPPDYSALANFTLNLINADRGSAGLGPVSLSDVPSGQQHADSLAYYGTMGHWDEQGYKPYMRYTLLGGTGYVAENVAMGYCTDSPASDTAIFPEQCSVQTMENGMNGSEYQMMNNDGSCCNNGHRENILSPLHSYVSIGVAYNSTTRAVYLVEDFEDSYIASESLHLSGGVVTFSGSTAQDVSGWTGGSSGAEIAVYYDPTPANIPVGELTLSPSCSQYSELDEPASCQYQGGYGAGTQVTTVLAPCPLGYFCGSGNFTYAQDWKQSSGNFQIAFSIGSLESTYGSGVYTFYLWPAGDSTEPITSLSLFVATG